MIGTDLLIDINILIQLLDGREDVSNLLNDCEVAVSHLTRMELLAAKDYSIHELSILKDLFGEIRIINIPPEIGEKAEQLCQAYNISPSDAIIAASAWYADMTLVTSDDIFTKVREIHVYHLKSN